MLQIGVKGENGNAKICSGGENTNFKNSDS